MKINLFLDEKGSVAVMGCKSRRCREGGCTVYDVGAKTLAIGKMQRVLDSRGGRKSESNFTIPLSYKHQREEKNCQRLSHQLEVRSLSNTVSERFHFLLNLYFSFLFNFLIYFSLWQRLFTRMKRELPFVSFVFI